MISATLAYISIIEFSFLFFKNVNRFCLSAPNTLFGCKLGHRYFVDLCSLYIIIT